MLYKKFDVTRREDGPDWDANDPHEPPAYFVLDLANDQAAWVALRAYVAATDDWSLAEDYEALLADEISLDVLRLPYAEASKLYTDTASDENPPESA